MPRGKAPGAVPRWPRPSEQLGGLGARPRRGGLGVVLGLALVLLALVPVYAFTPVGSWVWYEALAASPAENAFLVIPRSLRPQPNAGADAQSVVVPAPAATAVAAAVATPAPVPTAAVDDARFAVLLMGYGGGNHDGALLTDSMMVVVVDPARKTLTLLSLPRDSWVPLAFGGKTIMYNKVNSAYAFAADSTVAPDRLARYQGGRGPGNFAMDTVSRLVGIPIRYYVALDFQGFRDMINAVGGVDVNVPDEFSARYPKNDDPSVDASWMTVKFTPGPQHFDGERAIEYARARETLDNVDEGTDFARSRRQRLIMEAFKDRVLQPGGLIHLPQLLEIASQHVNTNYAVPDAAGLAQLVLGWKSVTMYQTALTSANYLEDATGPDGTYAVVPSTTDHSWSQVRAFARRLYDDPAAGVAMADTQVLVENDTGVPGVAGRISDSLSSLGYLVQDPVTGTERSQTRVLDRSGGKAGALVHQLAGDLKLSDPEVVTGDPSDPPSVVVELGTNEAGLTLSVPADRSAPVSVEGIERFGVWSTDPVAPPPTPTPRPIPTRAPAVAKAPEPTDTPTTKPTPLPRATPSPTAVPRATARPLPARAPALPRPKLETRPPASTGGASYALP